MIDSIRLLMMSKSEYRISNRPSTDQHVFSVRLIQKKWVSCVAFDFALIPLIHMKIYTYMQLKSKYFHREYFHNFIHSKSIRFGL